MIVVFDKEYLRKLYLEGKDDKKHRFQPDIIKRYKRCIDSLRNADKIEELFLISSLNYEKLTGDKKDLSSIRVNDRYRVEFKENEAAEGNTTLTVCNIIELSKHYE